MSFTSFDKVSSFNEPKKYEITLNAGFLIECWGASGGSLVSGEGSKGAYISGVLRLTCSQKLFLFVGERGKSNSREETFNGGVKDYFSS